jgi:hypothetical protein
MATIGKVSAVFTASTSGLRTGVNQASRSMQQMQQSVAGLRGQLSTLTAISGAQLFGQIASAASQAVRSMVSFGQSQAQVIDDTSKLAARLGMTYGELAGLSLAGDLAGVSMDTIGAAVTKADVAFVRAAEGSKTAADAFSSIGLSIDNLQGLSAAERFDAIVNAIAALPTEAQRAEAAVQLFGRSGAQLLPLFAGGAEGIAAARAEAERFGLTLTNMQGQNVESMNDAFTRAQQAVAGVVQQVVAYLAPAIDGVTTAFSDLIGNVGGATIGQTIGDGILQGARFLAQIGDYLIQNLSGVFSYLSEVGGQWSAVWQFGQRVASFFAGIGDSLQAAFGILILGITGPVQALMTAAQSIGNALGIDTSGLDEALAGVQGFNNTIADGITENLDSAATNFANAFGTKAEEVGQAIPGPLTQTLDAAIARAQEAAAAVDVAEKQTLEVVQKVDAREIREAVQGSDSRSAEGIREMFRLMRGDNDAQVQERIAAASERTAAALERGDDIEFDVADLAPAAGA